MSTIQQREDRLTSRIHSLEKEIASVTAENQLALDKVTRVSAYEKEEMQRTIDDLKMQLEMLKNTRVELLKGAQVARTSLKAQAEEKEVIIDELTARLSQMVDETGQKEAEIAALKDKSNALIDEKLELENEKYRLQKELRLKMEEIEKLSEGLKKNKIGRLNSKARLEQTSTKTILEKNQLIAKLEGDISSLNKENQQINDLLIDARKEIEDLTNQVTEYRIELEFSKTDIQKKLQDALEKGALKAAQVNEMKGLLAEEKQITKKQAEEIEELLRRLRAQKESAAAASLDDGAEQKMQKQLDALKAELNDATEKFEKSNADLDHCQQEVAALEQRGKVGEKEKEELRGELQAVLGDYQDVLSRLEHADAQNNDLDGKLHAISARHDIQKLEIERLMKEKEKNSHQKAPSDHVTLVFTDVEGSTVQWEWNPEVMAAALRVHNELIRTKIEEFDGYEVKTEGDAFMVAFQNSQSAMSFCLAVQVALLDAQWPDTLFMHAKSRIERDESQLLYRGLRVRMGIHCGSPRAEPDPCTGRMDYFGQMVNRAARVEGLANGGQIVMSNDVLSDLGGTFENCEILDLGKFELKGINEPTHVHQVLPKALVGRQFENESGSVEEKNDLEKELELMKKQNDELKASLSSLKQDIDKSMMEGKQLLALMNSGTGLSAEDLKAQLKKLLKSQARADADLQEARQQNEDLRKRSIQALDKEENMLHRENLRLISQLAELRKEKAADGTKQVVKVVEKVVLKSGGNGGMSNVMKFVMLLLFLRIFIFPMIDIHKLFA